MSRFSCSAPRSHRMIAAAALPARCPSLRLVIPTAVGVRLGCPESTKLGTGYKSESADPTWNVPLASASSGRPQSGSTRMTRPHPPSPSPGPVVRIRARPVAYAETRRLGLRRSAAAALSDGIGGTDPSQPGCVGGPCPSRSRRTAGRTGSSVTRTDDLSTEGLPDMDPSQPGPRARLRSSCHADGPWTAVTDSGSGPVSALRRRPDCAVVAFQAPGPGPQPENLNPRSVLTRIFSRWPARRRPARPLAEFALHPSPDCSGPLSTGISPLARARSESVRLGVDDWGSWQYGLWIPS
jgi:hypothetical protein